MPQIQKRTVEPDITLLEITGRISLGRDCQDVEWAVEDLIRENKKKVVFDLSRLEYLDSMGIGVIVMCCTKMKEAGGELRLAALQPKIVELMKVTKLDQIWQLYPTTGAAFENFSVS